MKKCLEVEEVNLDKLRIELIYSTTSEGKVVLDHLYQKEKLQKESLNSFNKCQVEIKRLIQKRFDNQFNSKNDFLHTGLRNKKVTVKADLFGRDDPCIEVK